MSRAAVFTVCVIVFFSFAEKKETSLPDQYGETEESPPDQNISETNNKSDLTGTDPHGGISMLPDSDLSIIPSIHALKGDTFPDCTKDCTSQLFQTLDIAIRSGNNFERFRNVCHRFSKARECVLSLKHCSPFEIFHILTSGLTYMCVQQKEAFNATIECIDAFADSVKEECRRKCNAEGVMAGWATYSALRQAFTPQTDNVPSQIDVPLFRKIVTEGCVVIQCYLDCLRARYNEVCYGAAGYLISEVLVRPVDATHDSIFLSPYTNFLKLILPAQCDFVMTKSGLAHYRIDKKLEADLKELIEESGGKAGKFRRLLGSKLSKMKVTNETSKENLWQIPSELDDEKSPLEDPSMESLWRISGGEEMQPEVSPLGNFIRSVLSFIGPSRADQ